LATVWTKLRETDESDVTGIVL